MATELRYVLLGPSSVVNELYERNNQGWYVELTGPLAVTNQYGALVDHNHGKKVYAYFEGYSKYDLSLQLAFMVSGTPDFVFMEGNEVKTSQCFSSPHTPSTTAVEDGAEEDHFIICPCIILSLKKNKGCGLIVKSDNSVKFAYKLLGWNYASR